MARRDARRTDAADRHPSRGDRADGRADFTGSLDEIRRDVNAAREIGADLLVLSPGATPGAETEAGFLRVQEWLRPLV